jgi:dTDP-4-dehydrorhamnose reductase
VLRLHRPRLVINAAADNRVDDCDVEPELALKMNAGGPHVPAKACERAGAALLHVSTDYVFGGDRSSPWAESDIPAPMNTYGISNFAGELADASGISIELCRPSLRLVRHEG